MLKFISTLFVTKVAKKDLVVRYMSTKDQLADILTKPLPAARFFFFETNSTSMPDPFVCGGIFKISSHLIKISSQKTWIMDDVSIG